MLAKSTKIRRAYANRALCREMNQAIATDGADELDILTASISSDRHEIWESHSPKFDHILKGIAQSFHNATEPNERKMILSIVAPYIMLAQLQQYIPGLSAYYFKAARFWAKQYGVGRRVNRMALNQIRYESLKVDTQNAAILLFLCFNIL